MHRGPHRRRARPRRGGHFHRRPHRRGAPQHPHLVHPLQERSRLVHPLQEHPHLVHPLQEQCSLEQEGLDDEGHRQGKEPRRQKDFPI